MIVIFVLGHQGLLLINGRQALFHCPQSAAYDGTSHGVTVTGPEGATLEYSADGETYSADTAHAYTAPGTYTVYWRVTNNGGTVYSQATFTITELEASEDWFIPARMTPIGW